MELHEKAAEALKYFETGERISQDTGRAIVITNHKTEPEWLKNLRHDAHGDMLPDDFRHEFILDALEWLADPDNDPDDYNPEPSIYNAELIRWLGSHGYRAGYCDEAAEEFGDAGQDTIKRIALGQWQEMSEVYQSVRSSLEALEMEEEEPEA